MAATVKSSTTLPSLLGNLVFVSFGELKIHKSQLEQLFTQHGLSLNKYQPGDIRPADAMRRATSLLKNRKIQVNTGVKGTKVAVVDVTEDSDPSSVLRYVGRKMVDSKNKGVDYVQVSTLHFDRTASSLTFTPVDQYLQQEFDYTGMLQSIVSTYNEWCNYHTKETIRNIVNKVVNSLMPTLIKPAPDEDSVARFIPATHQDELVALKNVIYGLAPHHTAGHASGCQFIELYDSETNKGLIEESVKDNVKTKVSLLVSELSELLKSNGTITPERGKSMIRKVFEMRDEVKNYSSLLNSNMSILDAQIASCLNKIQDPSNYTV